MSVNGSVWCVDFSPRTAMAINGAVALAARRAHRSVPAKRVARETGAPVVEMCAIIEQLKDAGLVEDDGNGSVIWRRDPAEVTLYDIAKAVGERFQLRCYARGNGARLCKECPMKGLSRSLKSEVVDLFKARSLGDLVASRA